MATRADIIEKLFSSFLLEKKGKDILLTSKATQQLLELVPEDLKAGADGRLGNEALPDRQGRAFPESRSCLRSAAIRRS